MTRPIKKRAVCAVIRILGMLEPIGKALAVNSPCHKSQTRRNKGSDFYSRRMQKSKEIISSMGRCCNGVCASDMHESLLSRQISAPTNCPTTFSLLGRQPNRFNFSLYVSWDSINERKTVPLSMISAFEAKVTSAPTIKFWTCYSLEHSALKGFPSTLFPNWQHPWSFRPLCFGFFPSLFPWNRRLTRKGYQSRPSIVFSNSTVASPLITDFR